MYRKGSYIAARIIGLIIVAIMGCLLAVQTPQVQTKLSEKAIEKLTEAMSAGIECDTLSIMPSGALLIKGLRIIDRSPFVLSDSAVLAFCKDSCYLQTPGKTSNAGEASRDSTQAPKIDTLLSVQTLSATFSLRSLLSKRGIHLGKVLMDGAYFHLVSEDNPYFSNLSRVLNLLPDNSPQEPGGNILNASRVIVRNFHYRLEGKTPMLRKVSYDLHQRYLQQLGKAGAIQNRSMDYTDLDLHANIKARALRVSGGRVYGIVDELNAREKSGYSITNLKGRCAIGRGKALIENIHLVDPWSDIKFDNYSMTFSHISDFSHYIHKVLMESQIRGGTFGRESLYYYSGFNPGAPVTLEMKGGHFKGYVDDFSVKDLYARDTQSGIGALLDCRITGIPDMPGSAFDARVRNLNFNTLSLEKLLSRFAGKPIKISQYAPKSNFRLNAIAKGPLKRLRYSAEVRSSEGQIRLSGDLRNLSELSRNTEIAARLDLASLELGKILNSSELGQISLHSRLSASLGRKGTELSLDSLNIQQFNFRGSQYSDLKAIASYRNQTAVLWAESSDPKLDFTLRAFTDFGRSIAASAPGAGASTAAKPQSGAKAAESSQGSAQGISVYRIDSDFRCIDLCALGIDSRDNASRIQFKLNAKLQNEGKWLDGSASIREVSITSHERSRHIGNSLFEASSRDGEQLFSLESPFLDARLRGTGSLSEFVDDLLSISVQQELPSLLASSPKTFGGHSYRADLIFKDSRELLSYLMPGLYVADSTSVSLKITDKADLSAQINSKRLAIGSSYLKDLKLDFDNSSSGLSSSLRSSEFKSGQVRLSKPSLLAYAHSDKFGVSLGFSSISDKIHDGELVVDGTLSRSEDGRLQLFAHPLDSYIRTSDGDWQLHEASLSLGSDGIEIDGFLLDCGTQSIKLDGALSPSRSDTLNLRIEALSLASLGELISSEYELQGRIDGRASICSGSGLLSGVNALFNLDSLSIGGIDGGSIQLRGSTSSEEDMIRLSLQQVIAQKRTISAQGGYSTKDGQIDASVRLSSFPAKLALPFLGSIFDDMDGNLSGELQLAGKPNSLIMSSDGLRLDEALLRLGFTGVAYTISGPLSLDNSGLHLQQLSLSDGAGGSGTLSGSLLFQDFSGFKLNSQLSFNSLKFLDNQASSPESVYGLLRASGSAQISGPFSALNINADVRTSGSGNVHIPTSGSLTGSTSNLLSFTEPAKEIDPYEEMLLSYSTQTKQKGSLSVNARLTTNSEVKAFVEIDKTAGNVASFSGNGSINLHLQPAKDIFELNGDYNISEGDYNFVLPGIISRNFEIQNGSSLRFAGNIESTELDVDAIYKLRTSLSTLIVDSTAVASRRQVDCGIKISDRLSNPKIDFSVEVPDLDPTTKSQVETALGTADKVQRQFLALLVMGSFIPDESSGVFNGSNILLSNATELMSSQLNSIFEKLQIPLDVGIGYQTSGSSGANMFDVAISTQLFNDRVLVGGSVGNRVYGPSSGPNGDVVGDLDIQIKLDPEGRYRFNIFSHSADKYSSYLDFSQRNGVGLSFQRGFSGSKKAGSDEQAQAEEEVTIEISADE